MRRTADPEPLKIRPFIRDGLNTGQWTVDVPARLSFDGKRHRYNFASRREAEAGKRSLFNEIRIGGAVGRGSWLDAQPLPRLDELFELWFAAQEVRVASGKKKRSSLVSNVYQLRNVFAFMNSLPTERLTEAHLAKYQAERRKAGAKPETINSEVATFQQMLAWARRRGLNVPHVSIDAVPTIRKSPVIIEPQEAARILVHLPPDVRPLIRLLAETGCRWGEATHLRWADLNLARGVARITPREDWTGKNRYSARILILSTALCADIGGLPRRGSYVFAGRHDPSKPIDDVRRSLRTAVKKACIERNGEPVNVTPKLLRACFATWQARGGVRERVLQEMLGHVPGSRVTKKHYEFSTSAEAEAAARRLWAEMGAVQG